MNRFWLWVLAYGLMLLALVVFAKQIIGPAEAHEWYTDTGCCGGTDCAAVPIEADWVRPGKDGYRVVLTKEQARQINPNAGFAVDELIPWHSNKLKDFPANVRITSPAVYHLCIPASYSGVYCLFVVPST